jgi:hypothetical protein
MRQFPTTTKTTTKGYTADKNSPLIARIAFLSTAYSLSLRFFLPDAKDGVAAKVRPLSVGGMVTR